MLYEIGVDGEGALDLFETICMFKNVYHKQNSSFGHQSISLQGLLKIADFKN